MTNYLIIEKENLKGEIDQIIIPTSLMVIEQSGQMTYIHTINGLTYKLHSEIIDESGMNVKLPIDAIKSNSIILKKEWLA